MNMAKKDIKRNPAAEKIADLILNNSMNPVIDHSD